MLKLVHNLQDINYEQLMQVYSHSNLDKGKTDYPRREKAVQILLAEQDLYDYMRLMLQDQDSMLAVWIPQSKYEAALRLEPYCDGLLIAGLETAPEARGRGYATSLLRAVVNQINCARLYSHINKQNVISMHIHEKCGFQRTSDHAVFLDGSVSNDAYTYVLEK